LKQQDPQIESMSNCGKEVLKKVGIGNFNTKLNQFSRV